MRIVGCVPPGLGALLVAACSGAPTEPSGNVGSDLSAESSHVRVTTNGSASGAGPQ